MWCLYLVVYLFNDTATTESYTYCHTLSLHDALPILSCPSASPSAGSTPKNGLVAEPGFCAIAPGSGEMRIPPVSVCHQVSTTGQRLSPTLRQIGRAHV